MYTILGWWRLCGTIVVYTLYKSGTILGSIRKSDRFSQGEVVRDPIRYPNIAFEPTIVKMKNLNFLRIYIFWK